MPEIPKLGGVFREIRYFSVRFGSFWAIEHRKTRFRPPMSTPELNFSKRREWA